MGRRRSRSGNTIASLRLTLSRPLRHPILGESPPSPSLPLRPSGLSHRREGERRPGRGLLLPPRSIMATSLAGEDGRSVPQTAPRIDWACGLGLGLGLGLPLPCRLRGRCGSGPGCCHRFSACLRLSVGARSRSPR